MTGSARAELCRNGSLIVRHRPRARRPPLAGWTRTQVRCAAPATPSRLDPELVLDPRGLLAQQRHDLVETRTLHPLGDGRDAQRGDDLARSVADRHADGPHGGHDLSVVEREALPARLRGSLAASNCAECPGHSLRRGAMLASAARDRRD